MSSETLADAAASGDRGRALRVLRDRLASEIDLCTKPELLPALARRLEDVLKALGDIPDPKAKGSPLDELASRRRDRGADTKTARRSGRR